MQVAGVLILEPQRLILRYKPSRVTIAPLALIRRCYCPFNFSRVVSSLTHHRSRCVILLAIRSLCRRIAPSQFYSKTLWVVQMHRWRCLLLYHRVFQGYAHVYWSASATPISLKQSSGHSLAAAWDCRTSTPRASRLHTSPDHSCQACDTRVILLTTVQGASEKHHGDNETYRVWTHGWRSPQRGREREYLSPSIFNSKSSLFFTIISSALVALYSFCNTSSAL